MVEFWSRIVTRVGILLVHMHTLGWGDGERDCSNHEHCRGKNAMSLEASPREVFTVS
jgi:hypothetical protein